MVNIDDANARELMAKIEGESWMQAQQAATDPFTFGHIFEGFQRLKAKRANGAPNASWAGLVELAPTIYGRSSMNRYFVDTSGEIFFSRHHGTTDGVAKAADLGFSVR
jgi:hypothetical protein